MKRLTEKNFNFTTDFVKRNIDAWSISQCLEKLQKYEDAEEQGLLLHLKAGVGSEIYDLDGNKYIVKHFTYYSYFQPHFEYEARNEEGNILRFKDIHIGKSIFLTKEEKEQNLSELNQ